MGTLLDAELVVVGIGVRPGLDWPRLPASPVDGGRDLATSVPDIFTAGDIARWPDRYSGGRFRVEHWVMAERQGQVAARVARAILRCRLLDQACRPFNPLRGSRHELANRRSRAILPVATDLCAKGNGFWRARRRSATWLPRRGARLGNRPVARAAPPELHSRKIDVVSEASGVAGNAATAVADDHSM